jgi:hypothetical protein
MRPLRRRDLALAVLTACVAPLAQAQFADAANLPPGDNLFDRAAANPIREHWAPKVLQGPKRSAGAGPEAGEAMFPEGIIDRWPNVYRSDDWLVTASFAGTFAAYAMRNNEFDLPATRAGPGYRSNPGWGEFFVEPGLAMSGKVGAMLTVYAGVSYLEAATRGYDNAGDGNTYHGDTETLFAGVKWKGGGSGPEFDLSYGQRDFTVGNGMLLWNGASNGPQRGANYLAPRSAWAIAGVAKAAWQDVTAQGFWLKPNDASSAATGTRLGGVNVDWNADGPVRLGAMYVYVPASDIATREGLNVYDLRFRWHPLAASPHVWAEGEVVWQRKSNVAAAGWYLQGNYNAQDVAWQPLVALRYAALSGDKPGTQRWEGFDPLYFGNSYPNWYQGQLGSMLFGNTNLVTASATLTLNPSAKQIVALYLYHFAAREANAPLAVPAPGALPAGGGGVKTKALATEADVTYTYVVNRNVNVGMVAAYAAPGSGLKELYAANGSSAGGWWFLGTQVSLNY